MGLFDVYKYLKALKDESLMDNETGQCSLVKNTVIKATN